MFALDFLIALITALLLTAIFAGVLRGRRHGAELIFFFVILLLATWAGGLWITPFGPTVRGISWVSFVLVGLIFALILTAAIPAATRRRPDIPSKNRTDKVAIRVFDMFFWILAGSLVAVIILGYIF
jgi:hypothetical protein